MWTEEELEQQRQAAMAEGRRRHYQHHFLAEEEEEDPFLVLGKMVKVAGKSIWRKVAHKSPRQDRESDASDNDHDARDLNDQGNTSDSQLSQTETIRGGHAWIGELDTLPHN